MQITIIILKKAFNVAATTKSTTVSNNKIIPAMNAKDNKTW